MKQLSDQRIYNDHMAVVLFALCWLVYFASYIGRLNFSSAMPSMIGESVIDASQAGIISMVYFFAYGIGQFTNGILADRVHPDKMIFTGLFLSGLVNLGMGFLSHFGGMVLFWCVNGYMQAMIWPPIMRIFAERFTQEKKVKYCVHITSTMALGTLASYLLSAAMIGLFGWRFVFYAAAVSMCAAALVFWRGYGRVEKYTKQQSSNLSGEMYAKGAGLTEKEGRKREEKISVLQKEETERKEKSKNSSFGNILMGSGLLWILVPVIIHGVLKDGVTSWVPTFISETFQTEPSFSILITTLLPVVNLTGAYAAQFMYQKFFGKKEVKTAAFFFMIAVFSLLLLWKFRSVSVLLTAFLFSVITASMMAVNTLFVNLLPLHFEQQGKVSTISGFLNAMAYLGSALSTFTIGILVEKKGWGLTILSWLLITAGAAFVCFLVRKKEFGAKEGQKTECKEALQVLKSD